MSWVYHKSKSYQITYCAIAPPPPPTLALITVWTIFSKQKVHSRITRSSYRIHSVQSTVTACLLSVLTKDPSQSEFSAWFLKKYRLYQASCFRVFSFKLIVQPKTANNLIQLKHDQTLVLKIDGIVKQQFKDKPIRTISKVQVNLITELDQKTSHDKVLSETLFLRVLFRGFQFLNFPSYRYLANTVIFKVVLRSHATITSTVSYWWTFRFSASHTCCKSKSRLLTIMACHGTTMLGNIVCLWKSKKTLSIANCFRNK